MKIGLFGGTFDPVHHGHLILAREAREQLGLDRVIFIPNIISPHKLARVSAQPEIRLALLRAAIAGEPHFEADDLELRRSGPSYAVETAEIMRSRHPGARFFYFIGADNLPELHTWKRFGDLQKMVQFVVLSRGGQDAPHDYPAVRRGIAISASEIRMRVAKNESIRYLVPESVLELIGRHKLYTETGPSPQNS